MIIIYAALQGIDPSIYEAARIDGANALADRPAHQGADDLLGAGAHPGLRPHRHPAVLHRAADAASLANGTITPDYTPEHVRLQPGLPLRQFNYASAISFALGIVVFIGVYIFLFVTRKRGSVFT